MTENIERPCAGSNYYHPAESAPEKINFCTLDGKCGAQNLDDQKACAHFVPWSAYFAETCTYLYVNCNCLHPKALVEKLKELKDREASSVKREACHSGLRAGIQESYDEKKESKPDKKA